MIYPNDWHSLTFKGAAFWREQAAKWLRLAQKAEDDGDAGYAIGHRRMAAECRENARLKEIEAGS